MQIRGFMELTCPATVHPNAYIDALRAPVQFNSEVGKFHFDKDTLREPLPHGTPDIAKVTDKIAEQYIETLDPHKVASQVRRLLIALLPSGKTDQELVSKRLNRSASTLQRQLHAEGLSYRDVLESTRRSLAEEYLRDQKHSQAQIAALEGERGRLDGLVRATSDDLQAAMALIEAARGRMSQ